MAFITNLTSNPVTGTYAEGYPFGVKNDHGVIGGPFSPDDTARLTLYDTVQTEASRISTIGYVSGIVPSEYPFSGAPPDYIPTIIAGSDTSSDSANSVETSAEVIRELTYKQSVRDGEWNAFSGEFETPLETAYTGCWNIGNSSEASPYIETIHCDNAILSEGNFITFAIGGIPGPVVIDEGDVTDECPCKFTPIRKRPEPEWGRTIPGLPPTINYPFNIPDGILEGEDDSGDCQGTRTWENHNKRLYYFSGAYAGLTGIFALSSEPWHWQRSYYPRWVDVISELLTQRDIDMNCVDELLRNIGAKCTYIHSKVSYRGTGISQVGVSGYNWTGWCDDKYNFNDSFFEARECPKVTGLGHLYACCDDTDPDGYGTCDLTPTYTYTLQDSCDCLAAYTNGRWSHNLGGPIDGDILDPTHSGWIVDDAQPDWNASNNGTGPKSGNGPLASVYWTGEGCFKNDGVTPYPGITESKTMAIVATGGGGPGAGDNIPPYWDDDNCDWMYAVQEVSTGTPCIDELNVTGCPTGSSTTVKLSQLWKIGSDLTPFGLDWSCCLSGSASGCPSEPALFDVGDYVNIADYQLMGYHKIGYSFDDGFAIDLSQSGAGPLSTNPFSTGCESTVNTCGWTFATLGDPDERQTGEWTLTNEYDCCDCSGAAPDPDYVGLNGEGTGIPCTAASGSYILSNSWKVVGRTSGNADSNPDSLDCTWGYQVQFTGCATTGVDGTITQNLLTGVVPYPATAYLPESYLTSGTACV